jgi:hypothetical protein
MKVQSISIYIMMSICLAIAWNCSGQEADSKQGGRLKYEYAQAHMVKAGVNDKSAIDYNFGSTKQDSVKVYKSFGLRNMIDAIDLMERKGWELINITDYNGAPGVLVTTTNFRRRRSTP